MLLNATAELERSALTGEQSGFNAREILAGNVDDTTVRQAVLDGRNDR